jgi:flagellar protein FliL
MSDIAIEQAPAEGAKKKKGGKVKKLIMLLGLVLAAIGGGGYAYFGLGIGGGGSAGHEEPEIEQPELVVRDGISDRVAEDGRRRARARNGTPDRRIFQATYIPLEGNFTSNLRGGDAFVQIGMGVSTYYDERVVQAVERHNMAIRSAILLSLSEADPVAITTLSGKEALKNTLKNAINNVLTDREGFGGIDDVYFTSFVTQ